MHARASAARRTRISLPMVGPARRRGSLIRVPFSRLPGTKRRQFGTAYPRPWSGDAVPSDLQQKSKVS